MSTFMVEIVLIFDLLLFVLAAFVFDKHFRRWELLLFSTLFLVSGMPALIYQIVWQRVLFLMYGVNAESVAVIVSVFMLGLGLGSLLGGWLSAKFPDRGVLLFSLCELSVAAFGFASLRILHRAAGFTSGASLPVVILCSFALLLAPTMLMGATLPLLVEHLVRRIAGVGTSVARLYFVNTLGSAIACYLCATHLMRGFGQTGSVKIAACLNIFVGGSAFLYARIARKSRAKPIASDTLARETGSGLSLRAAVVLAGVSGFLALGFEIAWYRIFAMASADRAPAFALLLSTYLAGIAAGAYLSERFTADAQPATLLRVIAVLMLLAGASSMYLAPFVAWTIDHNFPFLTAAPAFFLTASLIGSVFPLLCQASVASDDQAGRGVSFIYLSNIIGSVAGSLGIGFVLMQHFGLRQVSQQLGIATAVCGTVLLFFSTKRFRVPAAWALVLIAATFTAIPFSSGLYNGVYERYTFGIRRQADIPFAHVLENRNGVITVTQNGAVFGGGVYDGYFNVDPNNDVNTVLRVYAVSFFHPNPARVLMIGLASGSWGQILANHPQVQDLEVVEINPGYLQLIPQYPEVRSLLSNPKVHIDVDDGRRWLLAHPEAKYDLIVANTTYNWRNHATGLLSTEYLKLIQSHLGQGGVYFFNATNSDDPIATALAVFPYGLRVINLLAVSDSPLSLSKDRMMSVLRGYTIDGHPAFDPMNVKTAATFADYGKFVDTLNSPPIYFGLESSASLRTHEKGALIITDDNMGLEWSPDAQIFWH